jgi:predicted O-methyltransferase YrrM
MNQECVNILKEIPENVNSEFLIDWVRNKAGSSNKDYFKCEKSGDLKLQQVPEEYSSVILKILEKEPKSYLEIGIGNGGSWMTFSHINKKSLLVSHAVDNLSYYQAIGQKIEEIEFIKDFLSKDIEDVEFFNMNSDQYLLNCKTKYDVIFIDGDHSYEGVKSDYINSIPLLNKDGIMIFHDIASIGAPGVVQFWKEIKNSHKSEEFIYGNTCGMGIIKI